MHKFKTFKSEVELHHEAFVKRLRFNKGGEYYDINYFESIGINYEVTTSYTPQQNGTIERKNYVLT